MEMSITHIVGKSCGDGVVLTKHADSMCLIDYGGKMKRG
jgi:hypothetical protein